MSVTPESDKTVSMTEGPTPKAEFKKPAVPQMKQFMSPTDALVSPCTQKLMGSRRYLRKMAATTGNQRPVYVQSYHQPPSKLANKENERKVQAVSKTVPPSSATQRVAKPLETNI